MKLLNEIQQKLKVPKSLRNTFGNYQYRSAELVLDAVKPLIGDRGILTITDEMFEVGGRVYVRATASLTEIGDGKVMSCVAFAREPESKKGMDESQITGSASSYARKYALCGLFAIDDGRDEDSTSVETQLPELTPAIPAWKTVMETLKSGKCDMDYVLTRYRVSEENKKKLTSAI